MSERKKEKIIFRSPLFEIPSNYWIILWTIYHCRLESHRSEWWTVNVEYECPNSRPSQNRAHEERLMCRGQAFRHPWEKKQGGIKNSGRKTGLISRVVRDPESDEMEKEFSFALTLRVDLAINVVEIRKNQPFPSHWKWYSSTEQLESELFILLHCNHWC